MFRRRWRGWQQAGDERLDLKAHTRALVTQMERDLGTRLEWVAIDHYNTDIVKLIWPLLQVDLPTRHPSAFTRRQAPCRSAPGEQTVAGSAPACPAPGTVAAELPAPRSSWTLDLHPRPEQDGLR
jgi:hypothetical protein